VQVVVVWWRTAVLSAPACERCVCLASYQLLQTLFMYTTADQVQSVLTQLSHDLASNGVVLTTLDPMEHDHRTIGQHVVGATANWDVVLVFDVPDNAVQGAALPTTHVQEVHPSPDGVQDLRRSVSQSRELCLSWGLVADPVVVIAVVVGSSR
jgi:hypothetical protein